MGIKIEIPEVNLMQEDIKMLLAIKLFEEGLVSLGKALAIAGYSEKTFSEILIRKEIPPIRYENINLNEELSNA